MLDTFLHLVNFAWARNFVCVADPLWVLRGLIKVSGEVWITLGHLDCLRHHFLKGRFVLLL